MDTQRAHDAVTAEVQRRREELLDASHSIWEQPELAFEEHHAHALLSDALEAGGFRVERGAFGLDTAFAATIGAHEATGPMLAVLCEYDALPGIGHACGHNVIAAAGLGAALAAAPVVERLGGRLVVLGTPAEEGGGGKVIMIDRGAFEGIDVAMMVHPADADLDSFWAIAVHQVRCEFHGAAAHAAAAPELGRNALDAAVLAYVNIAALRQHIAPHERIHGIFTHGGDKPNIVPRRAAQHWFVRSGTGESLARLRPRVIAAIEAGALATGCEVELEWDEHPYDDYVANSVLDRVYAANMASVGRAIAPRETAPQFLGSTDMGNVSHLVPSLHPMIKAAPSGVAIHTPEFASFAGGELGDAAVLDGAAALAHTMVDLWSDPALVAAAKAELGVSSRGRIPAAGPPNP